MEKSSKAFQETLTKAVVSTLIYLGSTVMRELGKVLIYQSKDIEEKSKMDMKKIDEAYSNIIPENDTAK